MPVIIFGLLAISFGLWGMTVWWWSVAEFLRGVTPIVLLVIGLMALASGVSKVRDEKNVKDEDILGDKE
nr:similar to MamI protein (Magnetosome protein MamI) [uncultured bacterium]